MVSIRRRLGERLAYLCGMNAAEVYAMPYKALGVSPCRAFNWAEHEYSYDY